MSSEIKSKRDELEILWESLSQDQKYRRLKKPMSNILRFINHHIYAMEVIESPGERLCTSDWNVKIHAPRIYLEDLENVKKLLQRYRPGQVFLCRESTVKSNVLRGFVRRGLLASREIKLVDGRGHILKLSEYKFTNGSYEYVKSYIDRNG